MTVIYLEIGGYSIRLLEQNDRPVFNWPLRHFETFEKPSQDSDIDCQVLVTGKLPKASDNKTIYDSQEGLWKLSETDTGYCLKTIRPFNLKPYTVSMISKDFSTVTIWVTPLRKKGFSRAGWDPSTIINPVIEFCLLTRLARDGGVLMHAAAALSNESALVFTGPSGAGKSTLSDCYKANGNPVLSDERIIIRSLGGHFHVWGTPWSGTSFYADNQDGPLREMHFIRHGSEEHRCRPLSAAEMNRLFLQQCFLPQWDRKGMDRTLRFLDELAPGVPCFESALIKDPQVVDFLETHGSGQQSDLLTAAT
ncbi:MAG: hypothetical protein JW893_09240 [Candidatus Omnitrophica bacterium]|nr:hypothetical protein [Candidatus Omnitrophota bacterium]